MNNIGYVVCLEKNDPGTVRTHKFIRIVSMSSSVLVLDTHKGQRTHTLNEYLDFGIFPFGPENQSGAGNAGSR